MSNCLVFLSVNDDDDGRTVAAIDVLAQIGEIIGGSQREDRLDVLDRSMADKERHARPCPEGVSRK